MCCTNQDYKQILLTNKHENQIKLVQFWEISQEHHGWFLSSLWKFSKIITQICDKNRLGRWRMVRKHNWNTKTQSKKQIEKQKSTNLRKTWKPHFDKNLQILRILMHFWKCFDANHVYDDGETLCNKKTHKKTPKNSRPICVLHDLQKNFKILQNLQNSIFKSSNCAQVFLPKLWYQLIIQVTMISINIFSLHMKFIQTHFLSLVSLSRNSL